MKKILVAIDFSDCSINALEHAISIADKAESDILMVWVNKPAGSSDVFTEGPATLTSMVEDKFKELVNKYKSRLRNSSFEYMIRKGKIYKEIVAVAQHKDISLIVAGTHGASGFEEFWMGSNAYRIVTSVAKPIITIRGGVKKERELKRIVIPIDSTVETRQKVPFTSYLAGLFNAEVHILSVYTSKVRAINQRIDRYVEQVMKHLDEDNVKYIHETVQTDNLTNATIDYAQEMDANLISIMTEQERATKNLWLGPYAQQMVNHSPIPVLCIHPRELVRSLSR
jgi:nucleotide-binding universal stress UspA family protein